MLTKEFYHTTYQFTIYLYFKNGDDFSSPFFYNLLHIHFANIIIDKIAIIKIVITAIKYAKLKVLTKLTADSRTIPKAKANITDKIAIIILKQLHLLLHFLLQFIIISGSIYITYLFL